MPPPSSSRTQDDSESAVCPLYVRKCGLGPLQNPASQHFTPPDRDNADSRNISLSIRLHQQQPRHTFPRPLLPTVYQYGRLPRHDLQCARIREPFPRNNARVSEITVTSNAPQILYRIFAFSRWRALVTEVGEIPSRMACSDTGNRK